MNKEPSNDRWNANLYDQQHSFISKYGEDLIGLLKPKKDEDILDIGCGTGDIAKIINDMGANVTGVDQSKNMIHQAKEKYPHILFRVQDVTTLNDRHTFDAVFSNATLHWIKPPIDALNSIYHSLKKEGRFVAEFGGEGNVQTITTAIQEQAAILSIPYDEEKFPWYFPSIGTYTTLMEEVGFTVVYAMLFDRPTPLEGKDGLKNWIAMFGKMMFDHLSDETLELLMERVADALRDTLYKDGIWMADYTRMRVIGIKK